MINNGQEADSLLVHPRAATSQVVLNRRETIDSGPGVALAQAAYTGKASASARDAYHNQASTGGPPPDVPSDKHKPRPP